MDGPAACASVDHKCTVNGRGVGDFQSGECLLHVADVIGDEEVADGGASARERGEQEHAVGERLRPREIDGAAERGDGGQGERLDGWGCGHAGRARAEGARAKDAEWMSGAATRDGLGLAMRGARDQNGREEGHVGVD